MYSDKKNVLQLVALVKAYGIRHIVLSPGSRNSPVIHSFATDPWFACYSVTDERSAGFFVIGISLHTQEPVAVCCTSGTAVLNLGPAVAEAFYQEIPLLVITADRPAAWIGQKDGQTLPQPGIYNNLVKKAVQLPEPISEEEEWYCNRLINEALLSLNSRGKGPVQINIPLSEPLFQFTASKLPEVRKLNILEKHIELSGKQGWQERFKKFRKPVILIGQLPPQNRLSTILRSLSEQWDCVVLHEHLSNITTLPGYSNFDTVLYTLTGEEKKGLVPDLLITCGGHIVSKRIKQWLRMNPPAEHWHINPSGEVEDLFQCMTDIIDMPPEEFLNTFLPEQGVPSERKKFQETWNKYSRAIPEPDHLPYSDIMAAGRLIKSLSPSSALHLANSSSVRYAQLFPLPDGVRVYCNRGTSGIEGSVSTAVGYAASSGKLSFLLTGDLSFFYDMNGLWNNHVSSNLRILLNNNGGGEIFHSIPGLNQSETLEPYITGSHEVSAGAWAVSRGFRYIPVRNEEELDKQMPVFTSPGVYEQPVLMEVFTDIKSNTDILRDYYHGLK